MSQPVLVMILLILLAVIYLPVLASVLRKHEGQETAAALMGAYAVMAMLMGIGEALWRGGQWQVEQLFATHRGNLREVLFALYDLYEQQQRR